MRTIRFVVVLFALGILATPQRIASAAADWIEVTSPSFIVVSDAGERSARRVAWQFEQIRAAIRAGWPWARAELDRPFLVLATRSESSMREFAPQYFEGRGAIRPASIAARGPDRHYVVLQANVRIEGREGVNPYRMAYWAYAQIVLGDAFEGRLPPWFSRGLAAVLGNTNVTDDEVQFGRPIPSYVAEFGQGRLALPVVLSLTADERNGLGEIERDRFDAQCWALMHFLIYGETDDSPNATRLNELVKLVVSGASSTAAVEEVFGSVDTLDERVRIYIQRRLFRYAMMPVDAAFDRDAFPSRPVPPAEALALRASYLATTGQLEPAQHALDEARALEPEAPHVLEAEALLREREGDLEGARWAYEAAAVRGSDNFHTYVRLVALTPRQGASPETLETLRGHLTRAIELNGASAAAHHSLGLVLMQLRRLDEAIDALTRAVTLDPAQAATRLNLATALLRIGDRNTALAAAQSALAVARTEQLRTAARNLIARIGGS